MTGAFKWNPIRGKLLGIVHGACPMPDSPSPFPRPDVEGIKALLDSRPEYMERVAFTGQHLRKLIIYIEALEERQVKLEEASENDCPS